MESDFNLENKVDWAYFQDMALTQEEAVNRLNKLSEQYGQTKGNDDCKIALINNLIVHTLTDEQKIKLKALLGR